MTIDLDGERLDKETALALAGRICARATQQAITSSHLLELIGDFDAGGGLSHVPGAKSVAHWISYSCSMSPGVAREHVRIARALRRMPTITAAFRNGELSYSKVREITRVVDLVDEARLCNLARATSASQLARTIAGYRTAAGTRITQQDRRRFQLINGTGDEMTRVTGHLPADESAILTAALQRARDLNSTPPPKDETGDGQATPTYTEADALRDICQHYLNTALTDDQSGEDRSLVIIQIAAEQLLDTGPGHIPAETPPAGPADADDLSVATPTIEPTRTGHVPARTSQGGPTDAEDLAVAGPVTEPIRAGHVPAGTSPAAPVQANHTSAATLAGQPIRTKHVPAGTPPIEPPRAEHPSASSPADVPARVDHVPAETSLRAGLCTIRGTGGIEPGTARRQLCTGTLLGAIVDAHGDVLALGRTRRLVSKAQRRALMVRDQTCQFPGCTSSRHLQAHHVIPWSSGGSTDLTNLVLLCQFHHTCVHEGGITITRNHQAAFQGAAAGGEPAWLFAMPDGQPVDRPGWTTPSAATLTYRLARLATVDHVDRLNHPDAAPIQPKQHGERFDLHDTVRVLFDLQLTSAVAA